MPGTAATVIPMLLSAAALGATLSWWEVVKADSYAASLDFRSFTIASFALSARTCLKILQEQFVLNQKI